MYSFKCLPYRCVQLIEPALEKSEVKQIERLISIYMNQEPLSKFNASHGPENEKVHTYEDFIATKSTAPMDVCDEYIGNSIWREAPGKFIET